MHHTRLLALIRECLHFESLQLLCSAQHKTVTAMGKGSSGTAAANPASAVCNNSNSSSSSPLPSLIVFDLDDCLWTPEMHELSGMPSIEVEGPLDTNDNMSTLGTIGLKVPSRRRGRGGRGFDWGGYNQDYEEIVELYPGARLALRELATNPKYKEVKIGVASSSLEPSYSKACIESIEIIEGVTMKDMISYSQIGRDGQLTSRKTSHFKLIHEESGIPYDEMIFFDDCNWGDHVGDVNRAFGVIGVRTGGALTMEHFHQCLEKFGKARNKSM